MKYIRLFEYIDYVNSYGKKEDHKFFTSVDMIMYYLKVDDRFIDENYIPESIYDVNVLDFFKEILLNKIITFASIDKTKGDPMLTGTVKDVDYYKYKSYLFISVKLGGKDYLIKNTFNVLDYDADTKPLHKEVEMKKKAEKYNL